MWYKLYNHFLEVLGSGAMDGMATWGFKKKYHHRQNQNRRGLLIYMFGKMNLLYAGIKKTYNSLPIIVSNNKV